MIGTVISRRLASLHELQTVYGTQDLYNLMDIIMVDDYNQGAAHGNGN